METNNYAQFGKLFAQLDISGTYYLAYRDIPEILSKVYNKTSSLQALDFGCGAGRSTNFLKNIGFDNIKGVDKSLPMIELARKNFEKSSIYHVENNNLPFQDELFDFILSVFVLLEISSIDEMELIFRELHRVLKPGGYFTFVTNSEVLYSKKWLTLSTEYKADRKFVNGEKVQIFLKDIGCNLYDYYWDHHTYLKLIEKSNFRIHSHISPLGLPSENYQWEEELNFSPYSIYTICKD